MDDTDSTLRKGIALHAMPAMGCDLRAYDTPLVSICLTRALAEAKMEAGLVAKVRLEEGIPKLPLSFESRSEGNGRGW